MLTYPKSTMRVWRMPMHLSSGHVILMPGKFYPLSNFPQSDLGRRADSRWALPQISSLIFLVGQVFPQSLLYTGMAILSETSILCILFSSGSAETHDGCGGNLKGCLMACCIRNICIGNY